ncbi:Protein NLRC3 [Pelomyxa schiedti]|nr:Protein NLRC3 [Pelomyxa schiedti]
MGAEQSSSRGTSLEQSDQDWVCAEPGLEIGSAEATSIARALESDKSLVSLNLSCVFPLCSLSILVSWFTLQIKRHSDHGIGSEGAISIARALKSNKSLVSLNISCNTIGSEGAISIVRALESNKSLVSLNISHNTIGSEGATNIARALESNKSLVSLDISGNTIGSEGATSIARALESNKSLVSLDISCNKIGSEGATNIARALESNKSLVSLNLSYNEIGSEGAISIARALESNKSLVSLNILCNTIGSEGATSIARALESNKSLVSLIISYNKIGSEGATTIARALESSKSLVTLNISGNTIGSEGAISIARALESNKSLVSLNISYNEIGSEGATSIARALKLNKSLASLGLGEIQLFWFTWVIHPTLGASLLVFLQPPQTSAFSCPTVGGTKYPLNADIWLVSGGPGNTLPDDLFEIPIEILDSHDRPLRSHPNAMALATGKEYFESNFKRSPISSAQTPSAMSATPPIEEIPQANQQPLPNSSMTSAPVENTQTAPTSLDSLNLSLPFSQRSLIGSCKLDTPAKTAETLTSEIPLHNQLKTSPSEIPTPATNTPPTAPTSPLNSLRLSLPSKPPTTAPKPETILIPQDNHQPLPLPNSSMDSAPVTNTQTASTSLNSPNFPLTFDQPPTACKLDTPAQTPGTLTSAETETPFQIQTANADQTCLWLESVGVDDDCLKIIRANKLRGRTLANCSVQKLCDLGLVFGDAEFIVEEVKMHLARSCQEQSCHSSLKSMIVGAEPLFGADMRYKCFAFVVGNQSYGERSLKNAINDADSICEFLKNKCQFEVVCHKNVPNLDVFNSNLRKFKEALIKQKRAGNKVASIFYFAGHGRQVDGHNFLLMTEDESAFTETSYDLMDVKAPMLGTVIDVMKRYSDLTIGILDACRQSNEKSALKTRGSEATTELQLTKEDFRAGCILIYPTSPGRTTLDVCTLPNRQNHGFFTGCFLDGFGTCNEHTNSQHIFEFSKFSTHV